MRIAVGCDLQEFERYYKKPAQDREWQGAFGFTEELDTRWARVLAENPSLLLVWRENDEIIGHAIWHETSTDEHRTGDPREQEDREILRKLCGGKTGNIVELHEIWLKKAHRGKGYGEKFFEFFEVFHQKAGLRRHHLLRRSPCRDNDLSKERLERGLSDKGRVVRLLSFAEHRITSLHKQIRRYDAFLVFL